MTQGFSVGDRVYHSGRQDFGNVTSIENEVVKVEFENPTPRGNRSIGEFDEVWFRTHPGWLKRASEELRHKHLEDHDVLVARGEAEPL